nr:response regulator transcription factor [Arthrobacter polaris]
MNETSRRCLPAPVRARYKPTSEQHSPTGNPEPSNRYWAHRQLLLRGHHTPKLRRDDLLTSREREVLGLVSRGFSNRQIANRLFLSEKTVRNHVERTYAKIGASNRVGASLYALQHGLVAPLGEADVES